MMSNFWFDYFSQVIYCTIFGLTSSSAYLLTALILIDVIGLKYIIQGYGIQMFVTGVGLGIGPPIIGKIHIFNALFSYESNMSSPH